MSKLDNYIKFLPKEWAPATNPMLSALLKAWAGADDDILTQLQNTKAQLFVSTATGVYLDKAASNFGVTRPLALGLLDSDFQKLIPNLSLKQKQITKSFYDTMDVFWGPNFSRAGQAATLNEPYNVIEGQAFTVSIDGGASQTVMIGPGDIQIQGAATCLELSRIIGRLKGIVSEIVTNQITGTKNLYFRTNTPGIRGSIEFVTGFDAFGIDLNYKFRVTDLPQRTVIYQISPGQILIELPAIVPTLRRTLRGSHHFHADASLATYVPPANGIWQGSFLFSTKSDPFVPTNVMCKLVTPIIRGSIMNQITVDSAVDFPLTSGNLIIDFGTESMEQPIPYITVPNNQTIFVNPGYTFQNTHAAGATVQLLMPNQTQPYAPRTDGADLAVYLTSPSNARNAVEAILQTITAAGIVVDFLVLLPTYKYLFDNPYNQTLVEGISPQFPGTSPYLTLVKI